MNLIIINKIISKFLIFSYNKDLSIFMWMYAAHLFLRIKGKSKKNYQNNKCYIIRSGLAVEALGLWLICLSFKLKLIIYDITLKFPEFLSE